MYTVKLFFFKFIVYHATYLLSSKSLVIYPAIYNANHLSLGWPVSRRGRAFLEISLYFSIGPSCLKAWGRAVPRADLSGPSCPSGRAVQSPYIKIYINIKVVFDTGVAWYVKYIFYVHDIVGSCI